MSFCKASDKDLNLADLTDVARKRGIPVSNGTSRRRLCELLNAKEIGIVAEEKRADDLQCDTFAASVGTLTEMIDKVIANSEGERTFELDAAEMQHSEIDVTKEPSGKTRALKDVATQFVVRECFRSEDSLFHFLHFVYNIFNHALHLYRKKRNIAAKQLFFVYKGGNVLRIVSNEFLLELPDSATRELRDFYAPFFKRGDADYSIYIDPDVPNYEIVYREVGLLSYLVQDKIRAWFSRDLSRYFDFFRYNKDYQRQVMLPFLDMFNASEGFENQFLDFKLGNVAAVGDKSFEYKANNDTTLRFIDPQEDWQKPVRKGYLGIIVEPGNRLMTITHNDTLDFPGGADVRVKFNLTRTKFIFTLLQRDGTTRNVGGELIDVSIPHRAQRDIVHFFKDVDKHIIRYNLQYSKNCNLAFNAYKLGYLINDLEVVLFERSKFPWQDKKYTKRINRLFYMYFVDIFLRLENGKDKLSILADFKSHVLEQLDALKTDLSNADAIGQKIDKFRIKYETQNVNITHLAKHLKAILDRLDKENVLEFRAMVAILQVNVKFLSATVKNVRQYCSSDGMLTKKNIRQARFDDFV